MTQDEKASLIGNLTIDRNRLRRELTCLQAKANQSAKRLDQAKTELRRYAEGLEPASGMVHHPDIKFPSADEIGSLIVDIQKTAHKLSQSETELERLLQAV